MATPLLEPVAYLVSSSVCSWCAYVNMRACVWVLTDAHLDIYEYGDKGPTCVVFSYFPLYVLRQSKPELPEWDTSTLLACLGMRCVCLLSTAITGPLCPSGIIGPPCPIININIDI